MTRPLLLSNGTLHVGINLYGLVHDLYYPWVGFENHARADNMRHRVGIWSENQFSWLDDGKWEFKMGYHGRTQIGHITAHNATMGITLEFLDCVADDENVFIRNIHVINATDRPREIRLFLHQVFMIGAALNGDTAQYLPDDQAILHYKGRRNFVIGAKDQAGNSFTQHSLGIFGSEGKEGTYRDAEDGWLTPCEVEFGRVDSVIGFTAQVAPFESTRVEYWLIAAKSMPDAVAIHRRIRMEGAQSLLERTQRHWHRWLGPAEKFMATLDPELVAPFRKSLLVLKSHIDHDGAVIASTDTTMLNYRRDSYAYSWPRDACYGLWPLLRMGYKSELKNYFEFCKAIQHPEGYLLQKFRPDKAVGSTWLPYIIAGRTIPPIQEDETASVVFLIGEYVERNKDKAVLQDMYPFVVKAANFMAAYVDETTHLPHASYDLWEEKFLTTTYTTAVVYAALNSAAKMAERMHKPDDAVRWQTVAEEIYAGAAKLLYNKERKFFYKGFVNQGKDGIKFDDVIDTSSFYGAFMFGLFPLKSKQMTESLATIEQVFGIASDAPTIAQRYERDQYYTADPSGMGNPWFITTLWLAEYDMQTGNRKRAVTTINWVKDRMLSTGVLSEQVNPATYKFASVAPLAWSQAEFLSSLLDLAAHTNPEPMAETGNERPA